MVASSYDKIKEYIDEIDNTAEPTKRQSSRAVESATTSDENAQEKAVTLRLAQSSQMTKLEAKILEQENKLKFIINTYNPDKKKSVFTKLLEFTNIKKTDQKKIDSAKKKLDDATRDRQSLIDNITKEVQNEFESKRLKRNSQNVRGIIKTILVDVTKNLHEITNKISSFVSPLQLSSDSSCSQTIGGKRKLNKTIKHFLKKHHKKTKKHHKKKERYYKNTIKYKRNKKQKNTKKFK